MKNKVVSTVFGKKQKQKVSTDFGNLNFAGNEQACGNSVTITCSGTRPVLIQLVNRATPTITNMYSEKDAGIASGNASWGWDTDSGLYEDGVRKMFFNNKQALGATVNNCGTVYGSNVVSFIIFPTAGTHTYQLRIASSVNAPGVYTNYVAFVKLVAIEL